MRFNKRLGGVIGALVMLLAAAGVVYAAFSATGSGSGRATAVSAQTINITATACSSADLYPGGPAGAICFTLFNPNPYKVNFTSVTYLPGSPPAAITGSTACPASGNVSIATTAPTSVNFTVLAGQTTGSLSIAGVVLMASTAPDACQGASFSVPIALNGTQE